MGSWKESDFLSCCGSRKFAGAMLSSSDSFTDLHHAIRSARDIWLNKIDVNGWMEAFAAHPEIGATSKPISRWSTEEQSAAMATATDSALQELIEWNARYKEKFGFVFLICASGRSTPEILAELKRRYQNRPIVELENAALEEMKVTELRLAKLFEAKVTAHSNKAEDRMGIIGAHFAAVPKASGEISQTIPGNLKQTRPPITTHVLDVARGSPGKGIEVHLEMWRGAPNSPSLKEQNSSKWVLQGSSITDSDGRAGPLMAITNDLAPGFYRISFDTGEYNTAGFFPYVSVVFEVKDSQKSEHFHVPLLLSPFSFSTYRGS